MTDYPVPWKADVLHPYGVLDATNLRVGGMFTPELRDRIIEAVNAREASMELAELILNFFKTGDEPPEDIAVLLARKVVGHD